MRTSSLCRIAVLAAALTGGGRVWAGQFEVSPIRVALTPAAKSDLLEVTNKGPEDARFQVKTFTWREPPEGEMQLAETKDLVVFPTVFTLKPGQSRKLRIAAAVPFGPAEGSYRVIVEELPAPKTPASASAVTMLMRMSVPVFLRTPAQQAVPAIADVGAKEGTLVFVLKNGGTRHFIPKALRVVALRGAERVAPLDVAGWYVLPGGSRKHTVTLTPELCAEQRLVIELETEDRSLTSGYDLPAGACAAPAGAAPP